MKILLAILVFTFSLPVISADSNTSMTKPIDQRSYRLGGVGSFSEMVGVGVKTLALSAAMAPADMDELEADIRRIAEEAGIQAYRESDLIVTDLFPADIAKGMDVMLLYKGSTLDEYLALKSKKNELIKAGKYSGEERKNIAREFGRMLSYPPANIEEKIRRNHP